MGGGGNIKKIKRLPDAEFEIMKIIWKNEPLISTNQIIAGLGKDNHWKPQTVLTLLVRLIDRGFLKSQKDGKERTYASLITEQEYLQFETENFIGKYYQNSLTNLVNTLCQGNTLSKNDIQDLKKLLEERR